MKKSKYSLYWKIITTILAVGLLPLAAGMLWAGLYGRATLIQAAGVKFSELAKQLATHIDFVLDREIHEAQSLALSEDLRQAVAAGPSSAEGAALNDAASKYLKAYQGLKEGEYATIFATDLRGRIVASTGPLDRNDYTGETWWKRAFHSGAEAVYISDLYPIPGEDRLGIDLALPILDLQTRQAVGVLKLMIKDLDLGEILREVKIGETGHAMLVGPEGRVLFCSLIPAAVHQPVQTNPNGLRDAWVFQKDPHGGEDTITALSLIPLTVKLNSEDGGIQPWRVLVTQQRAELFAPIHRALWTTGGLGALLAGLLALLGVFAARRLTRPILALQEGAEALAKGDLGHRLALRTGDELETLANSVNLMAKNLQQKTEDLLAARDYLRNILDQSPALIITTDPKGGIIEYNRRAEAILGYRPDEVVGKNLDLIWDEPEEFRQIAALVAHKGQDLNYETAFAKSDGTAIPVRIFLAQVKDQARNILGLVVIGEDLTDRKQFEASRLQAERLTGLHRLSTLLTHDLRSPMVGILKALALFQENYGKIPQAQAELLLSDMIRGGDLLQGTLNDLLDVYRDSLSAIPLRYTEFSLIKVIEETVRLLDLDARGRGVKLETKLELPDIVLTADSRRIQRVLFNLVDNAIKHSPPGGIVTLRVAAPAEGHVRLQVEDQGVGVPEGEVERVFDFLYEPPPGQAAPDGRSGVGVGLYFCRVTLEAHGGRVWAESCPAGGARFVADLPLTDNRRRTSGGR